VIIWKTEGYGCTKIMPRKATKVTSKTVTLAPGEEYNAMPMRMKRVSEHAQFHDTEREALEYLLGRENRALDMHRAKAVEHFTAVEALHRQIASLK
jgi:hypothetical protein